MDRFNWISNMHMPSFSKLSGPLNFATKSMGDHAGRRNLSHSTIKSQFWSVEDRFFNTNCLNLGAKSQPSLVRSFVQPRLDFSIKSASGITSRPLNLDSS